jgi:hypothetical protein
MCANTRPVDRRVRNRGRGWRWTQGALIRTHRALGRSTCPIEERAAKRRRMVEQTNGCVQTTEKSRSDLR